MELPGEKIELISSNDDDGISTNNITFDIPQTTSTSTSSSSTSAMNSTATVVKKPTVCIIIGMAGSGKTSLLQRINLYMIEKEKKGYYVNLDPAVTSVPFAANIDIRDTVNYREVSKLIMKGKASVSVLSLLWRFITYAYFFFNLILLKAVYTSTVGLSPSLSNTPQLLVYYYVNKSPFKPTISSTDCRMYSFTIY